MKTLAIIAPPGFSDIAGELERDRQQLGGARLIAIGDTGEFRREIAGDEIRGAIETRGNFLAHRCLAKVSDDSVDVGRGRGTLFEVDADDSSISADSASQNREPAAGSTPQVGDVRASACELEARNQLFDLEGGA